MKRIVSGIMLTLLLISMLTLAFNIQSVKADWTWTETIYIRADGSVHPDTAPVSSADNITYTLTDNIIGDVPDESNAIVVKRDNIVVDGAGYTLQGTGAFGSYGISLFGRSNVTIKNMEIKAFYWAGVRLSDSSNNTISGNNITANNGYGIGLVWSSHNNTISGNNITNNRNGISLFHSTGNSIYGNTIAANNGYGIGVGWASHNNTISGNNITNNRNGIGVEFSSNNSVSGNNIAANNEYGIVLRASNNKIYHNNFINNVQHVYIETSGYANFWDDGYPSGGNYWSDYTDVDLFSGPSQDEAGSDGIWDHPYVIDDNNVDRYPFTQQDGWEAPSIPPDLTIFHPEIDGLTVTVNGVVLPGTPGTTITKIHWDWGDGNSEDHWFPASHTYTDYGDYTITVTAYQSDGLTSTKTKQVSLRQPTPIPEVPLGTILLTSIAFVAYVAVAKWRRKREHHNL